MAQILNNSFENWDSPGTPGSSNGVCQNWTAYSVNGGTSTRQIDAPTGGGTYSVNIRSSASAPINSIGGIISDVFSLTNDYIQFYSKAESGAYTEVTFTLFDSSDNLLGEGILIASGSAWTQYYINVSPFKGQSVKIRFEQHTNASGSGYYSLIDLVECTDAPSGTELFFSKSANIAKDKTATASSYNGSDTPDKAINANSGDRWHQGLGEAKGDAWWQVDLGDSYKIEHIILTNIHAVGLIYTIKGSTNGSDWDILINNYTSTTYTSHHDLSTTKPVVRYLRVDTFGGSPTYAQFADFRVYLTNTKQETIASDAKIKVFDQQQTITSDALITGTVQKTILSDSKIFVEGQQQSLNSDSYIVDRYQESIQSDAKIKIEGIQEIILSDSKIAIPVIYDINNKITFVKQVLENINNKITFTKQVLKNIWNIVSFVIVELKDINNDFRMQKRELYNITNDVRFLASWQIPGDAGFQSLGKEYVRVYINSIEQTDVDVDSIRITKSLNTAHIASFTLGRAYDATKPDVEAEVEIKYNDWRLYFGYITNIQPADAPESMHITCQDEYWKQNRTNKYFLVGHTPSNPREVYYPTIYGALNGLFGWNINIGKFTPDTIDLFGVGISDCISTLVQESGNFGFYYDENQNKKLWKAEEGSIINLKRQTIGDNIGLYQVLEHRFSENVDDIINKYRVQMGDLVIKRYNTSANKSEKNVIDREIVSTYARPAWDREREIIVNTENPKGYEETGFGWNYCPGRENEYSDVFKLYNLPSLDSDLESWDDEKEPLIEFDITTDIFSDWIPKNFPENSGSELFPKYILTKGFTIDYTKRTITLNNDAHLEKYNDNDELVAIKAPTLKLKLWKKKEYPHTDNQFDDPEVTISNPLMFFTPKIGDYSETIVKNLNLSNLSIQVGGSYYDRESNTWIVYPTWNDSAFAMDYAKWLLSGTAYKKITGNIDVTLDAVCFYNIDLTKRIYVEGITESPMNIISIEYDLSNFIVSLQLENSHYYKRTVSLPYRGE